LKYFYNTYTIEKAWYYNQLPVFHFLY
jgi:hypothetical protein